MGPNRRALEREEARAREKQRRLEDELRAADAADAAAMIEAWNARLATGRRVLWSPTLGAAALAGYRWLTVYCPGCGTVKDVDLAKVDRHPGASISSLIPSLSCRTCRPNAPFVQIKRLSERPR
jgi:hypothetical protein